jgi:hypothetical protein
MPPTHDRFDCVDKRPLQAIYKQVENQPEYTPKFSIAWWRNDVLNHCLFGSPMFERFNQIALSWFENILPYVTLTSHESHVSPCYENYPFISQYPSCLARSNGELLLLPRYSRCFGPCSQRGFLRVILHRVISVMSDASVILDKNDWLVISINCLMFDAVCLIDGLQQL